MNKNELKLARNKVDQLDQKIFNLIKKRTQIVKYMLNLKNKSLITKEIVKFLEKLRINQLKMELIQK